jgi:hypothetical protein
VLSRYSLSDFKLKVNSLSKNLSGFEQSGSQTQFGNQIAQGFRRGSKDEALATIAALPWLRAAILVLLVFVLAGNSAMAQSEPSITATVDRTILSINEQVIVTVTVTGDFLDIPTPDMTQITDFVIVESNKSTQVSIINGDLTTQGIYAYRLQPLKEGGLVINPITINLGGQVYQTDPIEIRVIVGATPAPSPVAPAEAPESVAGQDFFVEAFIDNAKPYLGQQVLYTFRFYQAVVDFIAQPDYQPPSFTNFWTQNILVQPTFSKTIDGRDYLVTETRTALFPANLGQVTVSPAKVVIPNFPYQDIVLESEPVTIDVQSLPDDPPADFKGAVGQFEINARLSDAEAVVNEPIKFIIDIQGSGNIKGLVEPVVPKLPNWRIFESQVTDNIQAEDKTVYGTRRYERLMVPGQAGEFTIPAISFSYFDPQAGQYRTVSTEPIPIIVRLGEGETLPPPPLVEPGSERQSISILTGDIRHIKPAPTLLTSEDAPLLSQPIYWAGWILPVLVVGGVWVWQNRRQHLAENTALARHLRAKRVALKILHETHRSGADSYAAAHRALLGYLSDKLNRPTAGLTNHNLLALLKESRLDPALIEQVSQALEQIDLGRFAPGGQATVASFLHDVQKLINSLENGFKKLEVKSQK